MRRTVALLAAGLVLSACSSTVEGRARTAGTGAPSQITSTPFPQTSVTGETSPGVLASTAPTSAAPTSAQPTPTGAAPTSAAPTSAPPTSAPPTSVQPTTASSTAAPTGTLADDPTAAAPQLPPGFYAAAGGELAYRPMSTDEFDCTPDQVSGCFGIMVFSQPGCAAGASVTVGIFDKARDPDNPIGSASGTTPPIPPGGSQGVVIADSTGVVANLTARVQQVVC